jgi:hypothetical protein
MKAHAAAIVTKDIERRDAILLANFGDRPARPKRFIEHREQVVLRHRTTRSRRLGKSTGIL